MNELKQEWRCNDPAKFVKKVISLAAYPVCSITSKIRQ